MALVLNQYRSPDEDQSSDRIRLVWLLMSVLWYWRHSQYKTPAIKGTIWPSTRFAGPSGAVIPGLPARWTQCFYRAHRARSKRCEQHVLVVRLRIMGLHRVWQSFAVRLEWDHILPGFLGTVVHVSAHLRALGGHFSAMGLMDLSGFKKRVAESLPVHYPFGSAWMGAISQPLSGGCGLDRSGMTWGMVGVSWVSGRALYVLMVASRHH
jgi:hypothetical protein